MRIKQGFKLRMVGSEYIIAGEGLEHINFNKLISFNPSAAYLWQQVEGKEFNIQDIAELLVQRYHITTDVASADASEVIKKWLKAGLIEE